MLGLLRDLIANDTQIALSGDIIQRALNRAPIPYTELANMTLDELVREPAVVLYISQSGRGSISGHYTLVWRDSGGTIRFFDSYGFHPDEELDFVDPAQNGLTEGEPGYLSRLLEGQTVRHFPWRMQELADQHPSHTNTCGNYCILRAYLLTMSDQDFHRLLTENSNWAAPDMIAALMTFLIYR